MAPLHVPRKDHGFCNRQSLALCDWAASGKWHTTERLFLSRPDVRFGPLQGERGTNSPILGGKRQDKPDPRCFKQAKNK